MFNVCPQVLSPDPAIDSLIFLRVSDPTEILVDREVINIRAKVDVI